MVERSVTEREIELRWTAHAKEHEMHDVAHEVDHGHTTDLIHKNEETTDKRIDRMSDVILQLQNQSTSFLTRDAYDRAHLDLEEKLRSEISSLEDRHEALIKSMLNRHESDYNAVRESIQAEREVRRSLEGSLNTWKWLAGFLGASGVAGVILFFATQGG